MSELPTASSNRPRTASRLKGVAPPGVEAPRETAGKTIGRYQILEVLGKGAMGVVYRALDPSLDREVAVKTIVAPKGGRSARARKAYLERFAREAKAAAKMQHPAIVTIFDVGQDGEAPFMVLEYLPGESLADRLDRVRMPLQRAVEIARDLASALAFAHSQRVVHRDVKPANVLHAGENRWKLADFGIVRLPDSDLTQAGIFMGTPGYAPPEAIREGLYTPQADVFAWGAVLYELLSGRIPYEGPDTQTTNGFVMRATARSPRAHDPSIPAPLADVCMRALHPKPEVRYEDGAAIERAISEAWDRCLNEGLVHPTALAKKEAPHERVRGPMHGPAQADSLRPPTRNTVPDAPKFRDAGPPVKKKAAGPKDDDPTTIMVREGSGGGGNRPGLRSAPRKAPSPRGHVDPSVIIDDTIPLEAARHAAAAEAESILARARETNKKRSDIPATNRHHQPQVGLLDRPSHGSRRGKALFVVLLLAAGAATAYYAFGSSL